MFPCFKYLNVRFGAVFFIMILYKHQLEIIILIPCMCSNAVHVCSTIVHVYRNGADIVNH